MLIPAAGLARCFVDKLKSGNAPLLALGNPPVECLVAVEPFFTGINVREPRQLLAVLQQQRKLPVRMHEVGRLHGAGQPKEPYLDLRLVVELPGVEGVERGDDRRDLDTSRPTQLDVSGVDAITSSS